MGDMADLDAYYDEGLDEEYNDQCDDDWYSPRWRPRHTLIACRYCHRRAFTWRETEHGWRLQTRSGRLHACSAYRRRRETSAQTQKER